jgi:hypothetical protein
MLWVQVVEKMSAVIDGSKQIGFDKRHRDIQSFQSWKDEYYQDILWWLQKWVEESKKITLGKY